MLRLSASGIEGTGTRFLHAIMVAMDEGTAPVQVLNFGTREDCTMRHSRRLDLQVPCDGVVWGRWVARERGF